MSGGDLAAFFRAFAGVLFAACGGAALKADLLPASTGGQSHSGQWLGSGGGFTVCFGNDLFSHEYLKSEVENRY